MGAVPSKRSGHSFTVVGSTGYMFGGCPQPSSGGSAGPTNELFKIDMSNPKEFYWQKVETTRGPKARWAHSAALHNESIVVFGGFHKSGQRSQEIWILDTTTDKWSQPQAGITEEAEDGTVTFLKPWKGCPEPRGGHSGCVIGNFLAIFGGYGKV